MGGYRTRNREPFERCYRAIYGLLTEERIRPLIDSTVGFDGLPEALKRLADRQTVGRVIFDPRLPPSG